MLNICCSDGGVLTPPALLADWEEGTSDLNEPYDETFSAMRTETIPIRSEEHTSELQSHVRISYAVFCLKKKKKIT